MSKIFNWFFGSFFRTLGRIVVFILLGYLFFSFINISDIKLPNLFGVMNVNAEVLINDLQVPTSHYLYAGTQGNYRLKFDDEQLYNDITETPNYFLITMCTTAENIPSWYSNFNQGDSNDITFYTTDIPCKFSDVDYKGKLLYVYGSSLSCSVQGTNCSVYGDYTFYQVGSASYSLLGFQTSFDAISIDFSNGSVISQNQEIINQNQQIINQGQQTNDKLNDINSSINDSSSPNLDGLNNSAGWLPDGPIDGILNLPLTFLNSLTTNLSKTCNPVDLPLPFVDKTLTLPCVNSLYSQIDGLQVWINSISVIASAFILFRYLMNLYKWVDDTLTFRENNFIDNWSGV